MRVRRLPARAIGAAVAMLAIVAPGPRVSAAPASACTTKAGVTVIVDFSHFHLGIESRCAPGHPTSALAALHAAGFRTAGTAQYGDAFVCRINDLPTSANESCAQTPPANASWSFYSARPADRQWTYATTAVTSFEPPAGSIIAFAFGSYAKPGVPPSAANVSPSTTTSRPAPRTTIAPTPATVAAVATPTTAAPAVTGPSRTPAASEGTSTSAARTVTEASAPTTPRRIPRITHRTIAGSAHDDTGSPRAAAIAVVLIAMLGIGGGLTIRARRRPA